MRTRWYLIVVPVVIVLLALVTHGCSNHEESSSTTVGGATAVTEASTAPTGATASTTATVGTSATPSTTTTVAAVESTQDTHASPTYVTLDVETAYEHLSTSEDAQMVDVREPDEWATTGVPVGATLIPLGQLEQRAPAELAKDRPVYVICRSGNRSRTASETLIRLGYGEVYNVDGGIQAWLRAGLPVDAYRPST